MDIKINYKGDGKKPKKIARIIVFSVIALFIIITIAKSFYTVNDQQKAVITTFGKYTAIEEAGLHFKLPYIQQAHIIDVNKFRSFEIGYYTDKDGNSVTVEEESKMITGDYNIVNIDFYVEYKISDPVKYLFNCDNPDGLLKLLIQSQIRSVVGSLKVDDVITDGKTQIEASVYDLTIKELEKYDIGLNLIAVRIQDSEPPTEEVREAFAAVINAEQKRQTLLNQAEQYQAEKNRQAEAEEEKLLKQAEYEKANRINEANEQIAMFNAMYGQYALNSDITKTRMYYEALESALDGVTLYIDTGDNLQKLLPVDSFTGDTSNPADE